MGLWNFRLLGSTVTIGDTATRFPNSLAVSSDGIGWACGQKSRFIKKLGHFIQCIDEEAPNVGKVVVKCMIAEINQDIQAG